MKKKISILLLIFVCFCCSPNRERSARFSEDQVAQTGLDSTKQLIVLTENSLKLDFNGFLSNKELSFGELVESVNYIPLQTTKESLIGEITKLICVENYYFILDQYTSRNVFIFANDGTFIKKLPTGQGPQDIFRPQDIAVDEDLEHLIVDNRTGFSYFDYQGNFVKREQLPFYFRNFRVTADGYIFVSVPGIYNVHLEESSKMQVLITDKNFRIISAGLPFHYSKSLIYSAYDNTSTFAGIVNFAFNFSDKIYRYVDMLTVKEKYHLDFSRKKLPDRYLEMSEDEVSQALKNNDYYFFMGDYIENETHEFFMLNNHSSKSRKTLIFRDKASGQMKGGNSILSDINVPLMSFPYASYKDEFISAFDANGLQDRIASLKNDEEYKLLNERVEELFGHLDNDANPIIIRYKLKSIN
jgi:hypothetical protein